MAGARVGWLVCGVAAWCSVACAEPGAARIVGPDGTQMLHVHCGDDQVACFEIAGEMCPRGYYLSPIFDPHDGNFLVRCRAPSEGVAVASAAASPAEPAKAAPQYQPFVAHSSGSAKAGDSTQPWPPTEVARPTEPWPNSSSTSATQNAIGDVDLGY